MVSRSVLKPDKGKNADFRLKQIWRLDIVHHDWLSYSREGNVLHSSRQSAFACLLFNKVEEVQHIITIPSDSHNGINYPPTSSKDWAVNIIEIKDFIILWTYSQ